MRRQSEAWQLQAIGLDPCPYAWTSLERPGGTWVVDGCSTRVSRPALRGVRGRERDSDEEQRRDDDL